MAVENWSESYQTCIDNPPEPGTILKAFGTDMARLDVELHEGKAPFIYARAYVPCIVGQAVGWFLQSIDADSAYGWKCILLPKAREECLRKCGLRENILQVKSLKVVRRSKSGDSLLCEVHEYA